MTMTLHHVALASPRAADAAEFYTEDWGLRDAGRDGSSLRLATQTDHGEDYSLVLVPAEQKSVHHFCLVTDDEATYAELEERIRDKGAEIVDSPACAGFTRAIRVRDHDGRLVELGYRPAPAAPEVPGETRDAVPLFPAHIVLNTTELETTVDWYTEHLGLKVRDRRATKMTFLYCNRDHHTIAFAQAQHASLNHVAWEMPDLNQFFRGIARASKSENGGEKLHGPGRHGPGEYIFCYFTDPMGFVCEYETDGVKVDDEADYPYRVHEYSPESIDRWLGVLSGGTSHRFRAAALGDPDPGVVPSRSR
ncbi:extradiol ring-cleavage dioxygenase [Amycolatopsis acidicola]|uniref:Extradiol ring-cleavage dioxygenase n=1 Tax=Amycolatopsis acidicola TaxID=2596893 RepID=A0A5N0V2R0_9PSEU|nr:VOC family protein [Amycolatopsis acidicola]KAA9159048.1 extradiol ring-cleavage dioxygenase [Amycolatopsis acidicola]